MGDRVRDGRKTEEERDCMKKKSRKKRAGKEESLKRGKESFGVRE